MIAGEFGGRRLEAPSGTGTRPTSDRAREATFNALGSLGALDGATALDGFAGSGALGIEAISRGARHVTFVERDRGAAAVVRRNLAALGIGNDRATLVQDDLASFLARRPTAYDLALLDPPFAFDDWPVLLSVLDAGIVACEAPAPVDPPEGWEVVRSKAYGASVITLLGRRAPSRPSPPAPHATRRIVTRVLYPGSFDPFHNGHRELVETAAFLFDEVVIAAIRNPQKGEPLFSLPEREAMIKESLAHLDNVSVVHFSTLVVEVAKEVGADFIIKGLRALSDAESEMAQAQMNLAISGVHTLFLPSASASSFLASKLIREIARFNGDVTDMVPSPVAKRLRERYGKK